MEPMLIQVDPQDQELGTVEKMAAHRHGILHRAFSVFLFTPDGKWILQQRALTKYHSGGLWSNACCGHPLAGEDTLEAAHRRLRFEMSMDCPLQEIFSFTYRAELDHQLIEHEYDHVFTGRSALTPAPDPGEVMAWKAVDPEMLIDDVRRNGHTYTVWFKQIIHRVAAHQKNQP